MTTIVHYKYPDDPWDLLILMFGVEFMATHKDRETVIGNADGSDTVRIPIPDDEVVCDVCNASIEPIDPCGLNSWGLRCHACVKTLLAECETRVEVQP